MANEITAGMRPGYNQVAAIEAWLRNTIRFDPNSSETHASAIEVNARQWGVCRDLSHLVIALCRSLSIPARMVVGYLHGLQSMDLHAWFEAYVGGRWYSFDATQHGMRGGYVAIGYGRDAADVAPAMFGGILLAATYHSFRLAPILYGFILPHCIVLMVGGHYTYAEVPKSRSPEVPKSRSPDVRCSMDCLVLSEITTIKWGISWYTGLYLGHSV
jgi:hypothetical protein